MVKPLPVVFIVQDAAAANLVVGGLTVVERNRLLAEKAGFVVLKREAVGQGGDQSLEGIQNSFAAAPCLVVRGDFQYPLAFFSEVFRRIQIDPSITHIFRATKEGFEAARWNVLPHDVGIEYKSNIKVHICITFLAVDVPREMQCHGRFAAWKLLDRYFVSLRESTEGWIARHINKTFSFALTRQLLKTRVTPNQVTGLNFCLGLWGCVLVAQSGFWGRVVGAILIQCNSILDGCDGEIARLKGTSSRLGAWLDTIVDDVLNNAMLVALCISLYRDTRAAWIFPLGGAALACSLGISFYLYHFLVTHNVQNAALFRLSWEKAGETAARGDWFGRVKPILKRDFIIFAGMVFIILDLRQTLLIGFMVPLFAGFVLYSVSFIHGRISRAQAPGLLRENRE